MMKILATFFALSICIYSCSGQSKGVTPMHKFFQQYADSTIVIEYPTQSFEPASYKIISNKSGILNCFSYNAIDSGLFKLYNRKLVHIPDTLRAFLQLKKNNFRNEPASINIFFNIVPLSSDTSKKMWQEISKFTPWKLLDDKSYPECSAVIMDGGHSIMHLITKTEIKTLVYYAPYYYEKQCPGNKNRKGIVGIERLFDRYITFEK
ncbi:hypothetical protein [Pedobacter sandarakinus]|uniref:hypothetical protein n=1 Tax=Pedobacter sandarakinus TaxID=353156 RepID=UPI0022478931|nr:hypothetical protein [Pedobacter sandarakinus]MCX2573881.1 hypothetical protein [Pedobacter sandarakinus]